MQQEQTKTLLVNVMTGVVIIAVFVVGYSVFIKNNELIVPSTGSSVSVETVAQSTALIGTKIESTVSGLKNLQDAVEEATTVFDTVAFKNLTDFSVGVPNQKIGRENPFVPTEWKIRISTLKDAMKKGKVQDTGEQDTLTTFQNEVQAEVIEVQTKDGLSGDFPPEDAS